MHFIFLCFYKNEINIPNKKKRVNESVQNEVKEQNEGFLSMLLGRLGASLLGNLLTGKGAIATSHRRVVNKKGKGIKRAGEGIVTAGYGHPSSSATQNNMGF